MMAPEKDVTDQIVEAMRESGRSFGELAETLDIHELDFAEIVYRRKLANPAAVEVLSKELGYPPSEFDDLLNASTKKAGSKLVAFLKWFFERLGAGLIVAFTLFYAQHSYRTEQAELSRAAAEASAVSAHIADQSRKLISDFREYLSIAEQIAFQKNQLGQIEPRLIDELEMKQRSLLISLRVMEPFAPLLDENDNSSLFLGEVRQATRDLVATGEFNSFESLSGSFAAVVRDTQIDLRHAVRAEFDDAERRQDEDS